MKLVSRSVFICILLVGAMAQAELVISEPVSVSTGVPAWNDEVEKILPEKANDPTGYTECRETTEIKGAYLCVSGTQTDMNRALVRASSYIEGLGSDGGKGRVLKFSDPNYSFGLRMVGGHDLRGPDLLRYYQAVVNACTQSGGNNDICFDDYEKQIFEKLILPKAKAQPNFVVITYAIRSSMSYQQVVTHEILHAQYFNDSVFRQVCDTFWNDNLTDGDRSAVKATLSAYYDQSDELLMKNEFQAYILMAGAESSQLASLVSKFRGPLVAKLAAQNRAPVQVR